MTLQSNKRKHMDWELTWLESDPCLNELPWLPVAIAPAMVWSMNQVKAPRV